MASELFNCVAKTNDAYRKILGESGQGVYLYGAGFVGRWSVDYLEDIGITVLGFVDSDASKWGMMISKKRVYSPTDPLVISARVIIITSRHAVPAIKVILSHLSAAIMSIDAFVVHHAGKVNIEQVESLLSKDKRSLNTFRAVLVSMLEGRTQALAPYADNRPFFDRFGFFNRDREIFVDAGAYVGDSLERFIWSANGVFSKIYAFEPGEVQFAAMKKRVKRLVSEWALKSDNIFLENKALSSQSGVVQLGNGVHLTDTRIENDTTMPENNRVKVETVSLDEYFHGERFTFLKVDVEGCEADLLAGAQASIAEHRPKITLSVYHFPHDILLLPLKCAEMNPDYFFELGHHSYHLMETVLYCRDKND